MVNQTARVRKIRAKFGVSAFKRWGKSGGSPILEAWSKGRIPESLVHRNHGKKR